VLEVFGSSDYWQAVIRLSGPLILAGLGAGLLARAGVLFVGIEGVMLISAFFSIAGVIWTDSVTLGILIGVTAGVGSALVLAVLTIGLRMGDIVGGLVLHVGALGLTGFLLMRWFATGATTGAQRLEPFWDVPGWGEVLLGQNALIYLALGLAAGLEIFLRTRWGLRVRASGESLATARGLGIDLVRLRYLSHAGAGVLTGLAGALLGLGIVGTFSQNIVNGRGFIALACVILGAWRPWGIVAAALVFGAADAYAFQADIGALEDWVPMLPYVLVLVALATFWGRRRGPAELARGLGEDGA
jgi:simple sugar transport system permease protein